MVHNYQFDMSKDDVMEMFDDFVIEKLTKISPRTFYVTFENERVVEQVMSTFMKNGNNAQIRALRAM